MPVYSASPLFAWSVAADEAAARSGVKGGESMWNFFWTFLTSWRFDTSGLGSETQVI